MKKIGVVIFLMANCLMLWYYLKYLIQYFKSDNYYVDAWNYLIPLVIADVLFFLSFIFFFKVYGFSKYLLVFFGLALLHNLAICSGVERIPFLGVICVILSILYLKELWFAK